ncbi:MAG TPA: CHAT domain-containing protein [Methylomirabilota bacterium]|jgi:CHAT domain-containing protein
MKVPFRSSALVGALVVILACHAWAAEPTTAKTYLDQGTDAFRRGSFEQAAAHWAAAASLYEREGNAAQHVVSLTHLSEAYAALGSYREAAKALGIALGVAERSNDARGIAAVLSRLGTVSTSTGDFDSAETYLRRGLSLARQQRDGGLTAALLNDLGNTLAARKRDGDALAIYLESATQAEQAGRRILAARALTNRATILQRTGRPAEAQASLDSALRLLRAAGSSHEVAFTLVSVGLGYQALRTGLPQAAAGLSAQAATVFGEAASTAGSDRRTASYALGHLGGLYEQEQRYAEALELTRRATFAAQQVNAPESLYRWQWQSGRLLKKQGSNEQALAAYRRAVATLQSIRPELVREGSVQTSFRETMGPLYFELVDLLLKQAAAPERRDAAEPYLVEARDVVELFKVAELRDYFRDDCVDLALAKVTRLDTISQTAVVMYPIILPDRVELLVSLRSGLKRLTVPVSEERLTQEVRQFRRKLEKRTTREFLPHAQQLYDWLIRPVETDLQAHRTETVVFVPDGALRTIPMAALHDGQRFLVAKYALAVTPGLNLTEPRPINRTDTRVLALGLTEAVQGFPALPSVSEEMELLRGMFKTTTLVDGNFRLAPLEEKLKTEPFTIVHFASHGEFGGQPQNTFLLAFDGKLTMDRLDQFIGLFRFRDNPLELLTLSACDTAEGDDRAALGLAGIAVKAGARSAVATLWNINDPASAELVGEFYRQLQNPSVSRATALQRAQLKVLDNPRYDHPGFWAAFLLINNWL